MAFSVLPKPGSAHGPCEGECQHRDCASTRQQAAGECPGCHEPIGYVKAFWFLDDVAWHVDCTEE